MYPYYILVLLPIIVNCINIKGQDEKRKKRIVLIVFFIILFLLMSLKGISVGNDTYNYWYKFHFARQLDWNEIIPETTEPAFLFMNKIIGCITKNFTTYLLIVCAIMIVPVAVLYIREVELPILTIALFLIQSNFSMYFSGLRQSVAIAIGVIAFECVRRKKFILFLALVLLAFWVHNSAFILLLLYPAYYLRIRKNSLIFIVPIIIGVFVFNREIFTFCKQFMTDFQDASISSTGAYTMLFVFIAFAVMSFVFLDESQIDKDTNGLRNYLLLAIVIQTFASIHPLAMRMGYYFTIFIPVLMPKIIVKSNRWRQVAFISSYVMTALFLLYFFVNTPTDKPLNICPYHFIWEN